MFKYLLAGLLVSLLVLNSEALPTRANRRSLDVDSGIDELDMRAPPVAKKGAAPKVCPVKAVGKSKRSLYRRTATTHPSGKAATTLFHGTATQENANSAKVPDLSKTHASGDYHKRGGGCDGGFYLTDSLFAAAQFTCYAPAALGGKNPSIAYVNQYKWSPPATLKHKAFSSAGSAIDAEATAACKTTDLLEGPMNGMFDKEMHKDFYQYTITNQKTAGYLAFEKQYIIPCANIASGKQLDSLLYQKGQASNAEFAAYANQLTGTC